MNGIEKYGHGGDLLTASEKFCIDVNEFIDFSANINPLGPPKRVMEQLHAGLHTIVHYPDPAQRRLVSRLSTKIGVLAEYIHVGNGAAECMATILLAIAPKTIGVIYPCFSEYEKLAGAYNIEVISCFGEEEQNYKPSLRSIETLLEQSDLIFLGHPNNPNGALFTMEELLFIVKSAIKTNTYVVVDEAFIDFIPFEKRSSLIKQIDSFSNLIIIRSMTKFYAIPGLRLGFMVARPEIIKEVKRKQVNWSVNQLALIAGEACLSEDEYEKKTIKLIEIERSYLKAGLENNLGWNVYPGEANFLLVRLPKDLTAESLQRELGQIGIMIRSCAMYPGLTEEHVRFAVRTRQENDRLLEALKKIMKERVRK